MLHMLLWNYSYNSLSSLRQTLLPKHRPCLSEDQVGCLPVDLHPPNTISNDTPPPSLFPRTSLQLGWRLEYLMNQRWNRSPELQVGHPPTDLFYPLGASQHPPQSSFSSLSLCPNLGCSTRDNAFRSPAPNSGENILLNQRPQNPEYHGISLPLSFSQHSLLSSPLT